MKVEKYDHVMLKDGRTATVVEVFKDGESYLVDVDLPGPDWDTIDIHFNDIESVISDYKYKTLTEKLTK